MFKKKYKDKDWLYEQYVLNQRSTVDIAEDFGLTPSSISYWLDKFDIESRTLSEALQGRTLTDEQKEKISKSVADHLEENGHPFEGKTHTDESKQMMSEAKQGESHHFYGKSRPDFAKKVSGEKNPSWKGGVTEEYDFRKSSEWKKFSFNLKEQSDWTCGSCGEHGSNAEIQSHHAIPVSDGGKKYDNIFIILCKQCHGNRNSEWHTMDVNEQIDRVDEKAVHDLR